MSTTVLCILDGLGLNPRREYNAVALADTPCLHKLFSSCPWTTLTTFGEAVGLPAGQMGNSEVGHLNIGAGRVVEQWLLRITQNLSTPAWQSTATGAGFINELRTAPALHMVGLFSDGGVHSHYEHALQFIKQIRTTYVGPIFLHLITDGRDTAPQVALSLLERVIPKLPEGCRIGSVSGRFFAMDRDKRWDRTAKAYETIYLAKGQRSPSVLSWLTEQYAKGTGDEFIEPAVIDGLPINQADCVVLFNFREDRMRQIAAAIAGSHFDGFPRQACAHPAVRTLCFTDYDPSLKLPYLFHPVSLANHLGEYLSLKGKTQLRVAETEKYAHVTYFFNGGTEPPFKGEDRSLVPSPRDVKTYDLKPEMSAAGVTKIVCDGISSQRYDLIVVNFANCDMVGHSGKLDAAIQAVQTVDTCLQQILQVLDTYGGQALTIADHGNAEQMIDYETGSPHTAHTTYPVPCILYGVPGVSMLREGGALCDVAPTVLALMGLPIPKEMTGRSLIAG